MPLWALPLIQMIGVPLLGALAQAGFTLQSGGTGKQAIGAFLIGLGATAVAHNMASPVAKMTGNGSAVPPPLKPGA